jgi:rhodanese-related sulfurtransferase
MLRTWFWWLPFGHVPEIPAVTLPQRLADDPTPLVLDMRTPAEWRRGHIAGACNTPINQLKKQLPTLDLDPRRPVVCICLSAHRSIPAVHLLRARGVEHMLQLKGGMLAWRRAGLPTLST